MELAEIRASGLLELYVLGDLSPIDKTLVEEALSKYPELSKDLYQIGGALEKYAQAHAIEPSVHVKNQIMSEASSSIEDTSHSEKKSKDLKPNSSLGKYMGWFMSALSLLLGYLYFTINQEKNLIEYELERTRIYCDSIQSASDLQYAQLDLLKHPANTILPIAPTDKFPSTDLYLLYNSETEQNYVQVTNLPAITDNQSFQLWSLKPNVAPIPLTVFQGDEGFLIPVNFESGTATYAITIEPFGGKESPSLENLIGTVNVPT